MKILQRDPQRVSCWLPTNFSAVKRTSIRKKSISCEQKMNNFAGEWRRWKRISWNWRKRMLKVDLLLWTCLCLGHFICNTAVFQIILVNSFLLFLFKKPSFYWNWTLRFLSIVNLKSIKSTASLIKLFHPIYENINCPTKLMYCITTTKVSGCLVSSI